MNIYTLIADLIALLHGVVAVYLVSGTVCGIYRKETPTWWNMTVVPMDIIAFISYATIHDCPINPAERYFRKLGGQVAFEGSFITHYADKLFGIWLPGGLAEFFFGIAIALVILIKVLPKLPADE